MEKARENHRHFIPSTVSHLFTWIRTDNPSNRQFLLACTHFNPTLGTEWLPQAPPSPEKTNLQIPVQKQQEESQGPESFKSSVEEEPLTPKVTTLNGKESSKPYIPRALKNIQSFNKPGLKE